MTVRCPAKINLDLHVGPPRADGFHPIHSWFVTVGLYDTLTFAPADEILLTCDDPTIPADPTNLVWRAAEALRPNRGGQNGKTGVAIHLAKSIPAGGGLGGGSSDAAATLIALNRFWQLGHDLPYLHEVAAALGSDVPFFLHGPSSVCTGRGDIVTPVPPPVCKWAVLVMPTTIAMPTPAVFRRLDEMRGGVGELADGPPRRTLQDASSALDLMSGLANDLERPAFDLSPDLAEMRDAVEERLGRPVRMSGSGSTLFTLYDRVNDANKANLILYGDSGYSPLVAEICPEVDTF